MSTVKNQTMNDELIELQIKKLNSETKIGKRLWHEKNRIHVVTTSEKNSKNYYQMLKCFEYDPKPDANILPKTLLANNKK
jgi:hypothetical protein